jgi:hypothetical protein
MDFWNRSLTQMWVKLRLRDLDDVAVLSVQDLFVSVRIDVPDIGMRRRIQLGIQFLCEKCSALFLL